MAANPMYQFNVYRIGPEIKLGAADISFTNASLFMIISSLAILIIFNLGAKKKSIMFFISWLNQLVLPLLKAQLKNYELKNDQFGLVK